FEIVIAAEQILERRIERAAMTAKIKDPAVVAALKDQYLRPAGDRTRSADRHQIGFSAGIGKTHEFNRRKTGADSCGKAGLGRVVRAKIEAAVERLLDRLADLGVRMTKDSGGELAEEIDIFVAVEIPQPRALSAHHRQRKRVDMDCRAGIA